MDFSIFFSELLAVSWMDLVRLAVIAAIIGVIYFCVHSINMYILIRRSAINYFQIRTCYACELPIYMSEAHAQSIANSAPNAFLQPFQGEECECWHLSISPVRTVFLSEDGRTPVMAPVLYDPDTFAFTSGRPSYTPEIQRTVDHVIETINNNFGNNDDYIANGANLLYDMQEMVGECGYKLVRTEEADDQYVFAAEKTYQPSSH